ncbi:MAG: hypothetical protein FWE85_02780 [Clostridiales bacterium]|nr:hypothetical protein [Clostridiales bacterium]
MEIKIGIGFENLVFGMSQKEVITIMGKPNKVSEFEIEDEEEGGRIVYFYNDSLIATKFDEDENFRMYSIEVFNPEALMFGQKIMNKVKDEILDLLKLNGYFEIAEEKYDYFDAVFCEEIWSRFIFEFDRLKSVEVSPLFDKDEKIIWPEMPRPRFN